MLSTHNAWSAVLAPVGWIVYSLCSLSLFFVVDRKQPALTAIGSSFKATSTQPIQVIIALFLAALIGSAFAMVPLIGGPASFCFQALVVSRIYMTLSPAVRRRSV